MASGSGDGVAAAETRAKLRELQGQVQQKRGELTSVNSCGISTVINQANTMHAVTADGRRWL